MSVLFLSEQDVEQLLDMRLTIDVMEEAFGALARGDAHNVPRVRAKGKGIVLHSMCAAADYVGLVGWKQYTTTRHGARFHVGLYNQDTGELVALIEANKLGQLRTGAVTGLAAKYLAAANANEMGLFGTGWQAESQLEAVATACSVTRAYCYSRNAESRRAFAEKMSVKLSIEVTPVEQPQHAVENMPIVVTGTSSREPVFDGDWLADGALVCAIGSNWLQKAEIDVTAIRRAGRVVCDSVEACRHEAGDFVPAIEAGVFDYSTAIDLSDVVAGRKEGRGSASEIIIFKSVGLAIEDVALGGKLIELANQHKVGAPLPISAANLTD